MSLHYHPSELALADAAVVDGRAIGAGDEHGRALCSNTSATDYQEVRTDPSYHGQIMVVTYPYIGSYGAYDEDTEAANPAVSALVVQTFSWKYSNLLAQESLHSM